MSQVSSTLERNVKDRVASIGKVADNVAMMSRDTMDHLKRLELGQALFTITEEGLKGVSRFLIEQCEITRRWIK